MLNDPDLCKFWIERAEFAEAQHRKDPPSN
jgi:hypothetical protein